MVRRWESGSQLPCRQGARRCGRCLGHRTFVANLRCAAAELKAAGLKLLIEPVASCDVPGLWLADSTLALSVTDKVDAHNLFLQFDMFHAKRSEALCETLSKHLARFGHIQLTDNPGRNEPGTGGISFGLPHPRSP